MARGDEHTARRRWGRRSGVALLVGVATVSVLSIPTAKAFGLLRVTNCLDDGSAGSLRQTVANADAGAIIVFAQSCAPASSPITLSPSLGPIEIKKSVIIVGPGLDRLGVSGGGASRVFQLDSGVSASLSGMTIEDGNTFDGTGGGIDNNGTLMLVASAVSGNHTNGAGGGIDNTGTLLMEGDHLSGNTATVAGGGVFNDDGRMGVNGSVLSSNTATSGGGGGGGIFNYLGTLMVTGSTLSDNSSPAYGGGGIWNHSGQLFVSGSTLSHNVADGGGGIWNDLGTLTVAGSILTGNQATLAGGGAIYQGGIAQGGGQTTITGSLFKANVSTGAPDNTPYRGIFNNPTPPAGTIVVRHSTFS